MLRPVTLALTLLVAAWAQTVDWAPSLKNLKFREIGPASMGGRIDDLAVVESNPNIVYIATASAGVWKSENSGITWKPLFDDQPVSSIGDVTVAPSEPDTVWVGTGEANNRQSSSWGNGVYKSTDGGKTWTHLGLKDTHHIARILIHPANPNIVYAAAVGRLWGPNEERGVFKTTDGGKSWQKVLYINPDTGVTDLAMDPQHPDTLYAAAYQRRRTVFGFNGGGPGSGLHRTTDGGATWKKLTEGLPKAEMGRIGLDIYRRNPAIVYALVEAAGGGTGIYRSDDKGDTWRKMSNTNPRPMYFSQVRIDPNNDQRVWVLGVQMHYSEDGGKTFVTNLVRRIHVDFHAMWIDPANSDNMIVGCDGGVHFSRDRGRTWDSRENMALGQFYEIAYDMSRPYKICGGVQDNSSWCGPSATTDSRGIANQEWYTVQGGDGFYAQVDPEEPWIVYAESQDGNLVRRDLRTHESRSIRPREDDDTMPRYRFQWNSPVLISRHDRKTLYYGGNFVFKSTDQGDSWKRISPDLSTGVNRRTLSIMGRQLEDRTVLSRNDGVRDFPTITTLAESPARAGVLWAGTDDGNLHVSRDGETWKNVAGNVPGAPKGIYVSRVTPSAFDAGTAYVTLDGHRSDDFGIHLYKTTEYGQNWKKITNGIPNNGGVLNVVREHPRNRNLLFAGGEFGLYVSFNGGENWQELKNNLPRVPVDDIQIHPRENDLIVGTHGRSIWILDSVAALEQMSAGVRESPVHVFPPRPATSWRMASRRAFDGHDHFVAQNPPYGAILDLWFKTKPEARDVRMAVLDAKGNTVRRLRPTNLSEGVNRIAWDLRYDRPAPPAQRGGQGFGRQAQPQQEEEATTRTPEQQEEAAAPPTEEARGPGGRAEFLGGPRVDPGEYTVEVSVGSNKSTAKIVVEEDPRVTWFSETDRQNRRALVSELVEMTRQADRLRRQFSSVDSALSGLQASWRRPNAPKVPQNVRELADALKKRLDELRPQLAPRNPFQQGPPSKEELARPEPAFTLPAVPQRVSTLISAVESYSAAPSPTHYQQVALAKKALEEAAKEVDKLVKEEVAKFNRAMHEAQVPFIPVE